MITETIDFKRNSLNLFRLLAALQVVWGHARAHLQIDNIPLLGDFIGFFSGVPIFFTLSGFLIWKSIGRSISFGDYAKKRFWRIYPELWVAVAVEIIVLLVLYQQPIDWAQLGLFTIGQATIFQFWTPDFLRGYGCGTPNGALWTITVLIQFYIIAYFLYTWLNKRNLYVWGVVIVATVTIGWLTPEIEKVLPKLFSMVYGVSLIPYLWMFVSAAFVAEYYDRIIPFLKRNWCYFLVLAYLMRYIIHWDIPIGMYNLWGTVLLFCFLIGFSYSFPRLNIKTDISYGLYIYHMTIVNALIALGFVGQQWTLLVTIVLTCLLAWISTVTVGRLSVKKKQTNALK
ncbi:MAG: acyltransferase [Bacteroidales bacterium]|nr:acyltransferase [Bacteroidales bacterium]